MKKIILVCVFIALAGCSNEVEKTVKQQLKDPDSAQFKDINGRCGLVNAKNSYGGYTGFKRFYISNDVVILENLDDENILPFELGWAANCEIKSNLSQREKDACVSMGNLAAAVVGSKLAGVSINLSKESVKADSKEDQAIYFKLIEEGYKRNNKNEFAMSTLDDCLRGKIKVPS